MFRRVDGFSGSTRTLWRMGEGGRARWKGVAPLRGILISVNYSREWHVLLTSALSSSRHSGRIQFSRPSARSAFLLFLCLSRPGCENVVVVVAVATRGGNRQVLLRDARRLILVLSASRFSWKCIKSGLSVASRFSRILLEWYFP